MLTVDMADFLTWRTLVVGVITYYFTLVFYRLSLHPLARFPGPRMAAVSRWYEAYHDVIRGGQYTTKIAALHDEYGPIIRISPHELHVIDPAFYETLYRMEGRWHKYSWAYDAFGAKESTIFGSDHDTHRARRRVIAPFFSKQKVEARKEIIHRNVDKLCRRIDGLAEGTTMDLGAAFSAFTRDTANEYILGKTYNELDQDDFGVALSAASQGAGVFWRTTKHVRWFGPALRGIPIDFMMKIVDEQTKSFLKKVKQSEDDAKAVLANVNSPFPSEDVKSSMVYEIQRSNLPSSEKTESRVLDEVATVSGAAFETTAAVLRLISFHIYSNNSILEQLRDEITTVHADPSSPFSLKILEQLPYLTAIITEGLRLSPGISTRAARVTDTDLFYRGWRIPANTPVGMTTILMHTDNKLYPNPMAFDPLRWLVGSVKTPTSGTFGPFSRGTRICLGMHLAWAELYLLVAALAQRFDLAVVSATAQDFELERDNFGIGTKAGCHLAVRTKAV